MTFQKSKVMLLLIKVLKYVTTFIFRKNKMCSNRTISQVASSIIFATKHEFLAMEQHLFTKLHYSFRERK